MPNKTILHPKCLVCGETFETTSKKARICQKKVCKNKSRYILYGKKYSSVYKTNPEPKGKKTTIDCICPYCCKRHKKRGGSKWQFCREHEWLRYEEVDTVSQECRIII